MQHSIIKILAKVLILILLLTNPKLAFSQHLSFNDLLILYKYNVEQCDEFLIKKGFIFKNSETNENEKKDVLTWLFKRRQENNYSSNEYLSKDCKSVFMNECDAITYFITDNIHFTNLKTQMGINFYKFLFSDTNEKGVLSHYYLIPGPLQARFSTLPVTKEMQTKVYILEIKKMDIKNVR